MSQTSHHPWHGIVEIHCETDEGNALHTAMDLLTHASSAGLLGETRIEPVRGRPPNLYRCTSVSNDTWLLLSNLLFTSGARNAQLLIQGEQRNAQIAIGPRVYTPSVPQPAMPCDLSAADILMREFFVQFDFARALDQHERDAFCVALDTWAALVDGGGFPVAEALDMPSAIAGHSSRFEDPMTGGIDADGISASPSCFGLLVHLANHWNQKVGVDEVILEHPGR